MGRPPLLHATHREPKCCRTASDPCSLCSLRFGSACHRTRQAEPLDHHLIVLTRMLTTTLDTAGPSWTGPTWTPRPNRPRSEPCTPVDNPRLTRNTSLGWLPSWARTSSTRWRCAPPRLRRACDNQPIPASARRQLRSAAVRPVAPQRLQMQAKHSSCICSATRIRMEQGHQDYQGIDGHGAADDRTEKPRNRRNGGSHGNRHDYPS